MGRAELWKVERRKGRFKTALGEILFETVKKVKSKVHRYNVKY